MTVVLLFEQDGQAGQKRNRVVQQGNIRISAGVVGNILWLLMLHFLIRSVRYIFLLSRFCEFSAKKRKILFNLIQSMDWRWAKDLLNLQALPKEGCLKRRKNHALKSLSKCYLISNRRTTFFTPRTRLAAFEARSA